MTVLRDGHPIGSVKRLPGDGFQPWQATSAITGNVACYRPMFEGDAVGYVVTEADWAS